MPPPPHPQLTVVLGGGGDRPCLTWVVGLDVMRDYFLLLDTLGGVDPFYSERAVLQSLQRWRALKGFDASRGDGARATPATLALPSLPASALLSELGCGWPRAHAVAGLEGVLRNMPVVFSSVLLQEKCSCSSTK